MSERVAIRGPDAKQRRQPQRVQPGGFFRPLFGRSKRGHPDGSYQEDRCSKTEVRTRVFTNSLGANYPKESGSGQAVRRSIGVKLDLRPVQDWKHRPPCQRCGQSHWPPSLSAQGPEFPTLPRTTHGRRSTPCGARLPCRNGGRGPRRWGLPPDPPRRPNVQPVNVQHSTVQRTTSNVPTPKTHNPQPKTLNPKRLIHPACRRPRPSRCCCCGQRPGSSLPGRG
jgi:hypothetical protein